VKRHTKINDFTTDTDCLRNELKVLVDAGTSECDIIESTWLVDELLRLNDIVIRKNKILLDNIPTTYDDILKLVSSKPSSTKSAKH